MILVTTFGTCFNEKQRVCGGNSWMGNCVVVSSHVATQASNKPRLLWSNVSIWITSPVQCSPTVLGRSLVVVEVSELWICAPLPCAWVTCAHHPRPASASGDLGHPLPSSVEAPGCCGWPVGTSEFVMVTRRFQSANSCRCGFVLRGCCVALVLWSGLHVRMDRSCCPATFCNYASKTQHRICKYVHFCCR